MSTKEAICLTCKTVINHNGDCRCSLSSVKLGMTFTEEERMQAPFTYVERCDGCGLPLDSSGECIQKEICG
jgi:hypothetical protein